MDWLQVVILSVIQGFTEFLPISSSAHLILVPVLTNWPDQGLAFDVALHVGTLSAVLLYFRRELAGMAASWTRSLGTRQFDADARLAWAVILGTIPVGLAGLLAKDAVEAHLRSPVLLAVGMIAFGLLLGWVDWHHRGTRNEHQLTWRDVLVVGCAQALALFPGTSRAGITITAALLTGMSREGASRFSFLLSIPVILLAGGLETRELLISAHPVDWSALIIGAMLSGVTAYLCIHWFLAFIRRIGMQPFVIYRLLLGAVLLSIYL